MKATTDYRKIAEGDILFYGRLEDQSGRPVVHALVEFTVDASLGFNAKYLNGSTKSDANGNFTISGHKGGLLSLRPKAEGYVLGSTNASANFSFFSERGERHNPDPSHPVVIKMWKLKGAENLVKMTGRFRFHPGSSPVMLDLLEGTLAAEGQGDVKISVKRGEGPVHYNTRVDWEFTIQSMGGGIIQSTALEAAYTFEAPTNGYEQQILISRPKQIENWSKQAELTIFVKSRNGRVYSKVFMNFTLNDDPEKPCSIGVSALSNPNSSRNWEEEPTKIKLVNR